MIERRLSDDDHAASRGSASTADTVDLGDVSDASDEDDRRDSTLLEYEERLDGFEEDLQGSSRPMGLDRSVSQVEQRKISAISSMSTDTTATTVRKVGNFFVPLLQLQFFPLSLFHLLFSLYLVLSFS